MCAKLLQSCVTLCDTTRVFCPCDSPGKNTRMGCYDLLQRIFLTQGLNPHLLHLTLAHEFFTISASRRARSCCSSAGTFSGLTCPLALLGWRTLWFHCAFTSMSQYPWVFFKACSLASGAVLSALSEWGKVPGTSFPP